MYTLEVCLNTVTNSPTFRDIIAAFKLIIVAGVFVTSVINIHLLVGVFPVINQIILVEVVRCVVIIWGATVPPLQAQNNYYLIHITTLGERPGIIFCVAGEFKERA